jgi:phosphoserine aminotransferase
MPMAQSTDALSHVRIPCRSIPDNYSILLLQGGGTAQFAAIPLNLTQSNEDVADYLVTGTWSNKAVKEAEKYCKVNLVLPKASSYTSIPDPSDWKLTPNAKYVYYCSNETVHGMLPLLRMSACNFKLLKIQLQV